MLLHILFFLYFYLHWKKIDPFNLKRSSCLVKIADVGTTNRDCRMENCFNRLYLEWRGATMLGCQPSTLTQRSMHHQKSSSDSPFHANTLKPRERDRKHVMLSGPRGWKGRSLREERWKRERQERRKGQVSHTGKPQDTHKVSPPSARAAATSFWVE